MLIYDGTYNCKGCAGDCQTFRKSFQLLSCKVKIIDRTISEPGVLFLKPVIVIAEDTTRGPARKICAESIGKNLFREFNLDIKKILWVEYDLSLKQKAVIASFKPKYFDGNEMIYFIGWRAIMDREIRVIQKYIPNFPG